MPRQTAPVHLCRVETPEGVKDYVTVLEPEIIFNVGLVPEAIVGSMTRPLAPNEQITPSLFARNRIFVEFMHDVIARRALDDPNCQEEARRLGNGWVYIIDQRTPTPDGKVPPEDIIGGLEVRSGALVQGSYLANPQHLVLSPTGFCQLGEWLHGRLLEEVMAKYAIVDVGRPRSSGMESIVELEINAPLNRVAELFADPRLNPRWMDDVQSIEPLSGSIGLPGSSYRIVPKSGPFSFVATVLERHLPDRLSLVLEDKKVSVAIRATLHDVATDRTKLVSRETFRFKGIIWKLLGVLSGRAIRAAHRRHMEAFKRFAESHRA